MPPDPSGWPWPLNGVQKWFESLRNKVWEAAEWAARKVWNWLPVWIRKGLEFLGSLAKGAWNAVWSFFKDPIGTLTGLARKVWDLLPDWIRGPINFLAQLAGTVRNALIAFFKDPVGALKRGWDAATKAVSGFVGDLWSKISSGLNKFSGAVSGFFTSLWGKISSAVGGAVHSIGTALDGGIKAIGGWVGEALKGVAAALGEGIRGFLDWAVKSLKWLAQMIVGVFNAVKAAVLPPLTSIIASVMDAAIKAIMPGSPEDEIAARAAVFSKTMMSRLIDYVPPPGSSPPPLSTLLASAAGVVALNIGAFLGAEGACIAVEMAHPIKNPGVRAMMEDLLGSFATPAMIGPLLAAPVWAGVITPLRYRFNQMFLPSVPEASHLARFRAKGLMAGEAYLENMSFQGFGGGFAAIYQQDAARIPTVMELNQMVWREKVSLEAFRGALRVTGVREDFIPGYEDLTERIPGPADLIRFGVREAYIRPEWDVELPDEFIKYMSLQGYKEIWTRYFWRAKWVLVPLAQLYEMLHRDIIDEDEVRRQIRYHDFLPEWRDRLMAISWNLPGRIDARWMFRWGKLDWDGLKELHIKQGLDPEYADQVTDATAMNQFLREIRMQETNIKADLRDGYINETTARADLTELGYPDAFIEYHIADAIADRDRGYKRDLLDYYRDAYMKDILAEEPFESRVHEILVIPEVADLFVEKAYVDKYKKPKPPKETTEDKALKEVYKYRVSYIRELYRTYAIEKAEMISMWVDAGMDPAVAASRADYEELKRPVAKPTPEEVARRREETRIRTIQESIAVLRFRTIHLSEEVLMADLLALGYSEALAASITQLEYLRLPPPKPSVEEVARKKEDARVKKISETTAITEFRKDLISEDGLRGRLAELDYGAALIDAIVRLELVRKIKKPEAA